MWDCVLPFPMSPPQLLCECARTPAELNLAYVRFAQASEYEEDGKQE